MGTEFIIETPFYKLYACVLEMQRREKIGVLFCPNWNGSQKGIGIHHRTRIGETRTCAHHSSNFEWNKKKIFFLLENSREIWTRWHLHRHLQQLRYSRTQIRHQWRMNSERMPSETQLERTHIFLVHRTNRRHIAAKITKRNIIAFSPLGRPRHSGYNERRKRRLTTILKELFLFFWFLFNKITHRLSTATSAILLYWFFSVNQQRFNDKLMNLNSIGFSNVVEL